MKKFVAEFLIRVCSHLFAILLRKLFKPTSNIHFQFLPKTPRKFNSEFVVVFVYWNQKSYAS